MRLMGLPPFRIPDFKDFRFSPTTAPPKFLPTGPGGDGVGAGEAERA